MWVLDVVNAGSGAVETTFYLVAGAWSLGRKKCHFNFHADASISRSHALLRVGTLSPAQLRDPSTRPSLVLEDLASRFGSFVNQEQCFGARELKHGDQLSFGARRTILRVRYQVFILVASRIQRVNRARVNETCQQIGMHLVPTERKDATHCVMDPGRIVATVKVLWALVYNQPVVCTPWLYAILARKSMSEPLPRCEEFLPSDDHVPSVSSSYLPNPLRKTLYHRHAVVFLAPQSMEDIVAEMAGVVVAAYKDSERDELLLRDIEHHAAARHVLIVEPVQGSGFSSVGASSDGRELQSTAGGGGGGAGQAAVERRVSLFRSMGASFVSVQELAASVIFAKAPSPSSDYSSFSSSLAGHHSSSVQLMSFPEHLSLPVPPSAEPMDDDESDEPPPAQVVVSVTDDNRRAQSVGLVAREPPTESSEDRAPIVSTNVLSLDPLPKPARAHSESSDVSASGWMATLSSMPRRLEESDTKDGVTEHKPLVVSCSLVTKRPVASEPNDRRSASGVNFKRFRKGNGVGVRASAITSAPRLPAPTVVSVAVNNAERVARQADLEALEEQERIADELFAAAEKRVTKRRF
ncbi:hypothetical protein PybrP1_006555 [[Pythium] brassicae (nom. inval.)]|nr:hypothetical protein PybrP1_006555 [[Pythium] brassicae (nom. inval.)]